MNKYIFSEIHYNWVMNEFEKTDTKLQQNFHQKIKL